MTLWFLLALSSCDIAVVSGLLVSCIPLVFRDQRNKYTKTSITETDFPCARILRAAHSLSLVRAQEMHKFGLHVKINGTNMCQELCLVKLKYADEQRLLLYNEKRQEHIKKMTGIGSS